MFRLGTAEWPVDRPLRILCLGAHCDDIEIGCGGTILTLAGQFSSASVHWVVFASDQERAGEAKSSAKSFLKGFRDSRVIVKSFPESFFPYDASAIKEYFSEIKVEANPDIIFTHYRNDRHQDHRLISDLTWQTFRNNLILEYEILKYDGDLGSPNVFVPLSAEIRDRKIALLFEHFRSQKEKTWFDKESFCGLIRIRGIECNSSTDGAEAFYGRKIVL